MFIYFKPAEHDQLEANEIPIFELDHFNIYEISPAGINHFFEGDHGKRFSDRYEVTQAKFSNNKKALFESIRADNASYKDEIVSLNGNVHYVRDDGLQFNSDEGVYDQNRSIITTDGVFTITKNANSVHGTHLYYDLNLDTVSADHIRGSYQLN